MLPATLMYIYVGVLGATTLEEAVKKDPSLTQKKWLLLGLGFVATAAVTVYVTKLAGKALKEHSNVEDDMTDEQSKNGADTKTDAGSEDENKTPLKRGWTKGTTAMLVVALVLAGRRGAFHHVGSIAFPALAEPPVHLVQAFIAIGPARQPPACLQGGLVALPVLFEGV